VNLVDSSGWIEYFTDGDNAGYFGRPLADAQHLVVPSISLFEVYRFVLRHSGRGPALRAAAAMRQGTVVELDATLALDAAELSVESNLPLAASIIYATALSRDATLWTQDSDFEGLEGVNYRARGSGGTETTLSPDSILTHRDADRR
jgi:predicted nucleic acid-binding protein